MQAMACVAGSRLVPSFVCTSSPFPRSSAQSNSLVECQRHRLRSWFVKRSTRQCVRPSKASPSRDVVSDDIEGIPVGEYGERYLVPNHMEDDDDGIGDVKVECDSNGCIIVIPQSRSLADEDDGASFLRCDITGCYFSPEAPAVKSFEVIEGAGWRLGFETAPESESSFCAIVGAGGWSIALTGGEFNDFCTLIQAIRKGIMTIDEDEVSARDDVVLQVEKGSIWMQCSIPKKRVGALQLLWQPGVPRNLVDTQLKEAFEVRFVISGSASKRQAEGHWPAEAVMDMLKKIDSSSLDQPGAPSYFGITGHDLDSEVLVVATSRAKINSQNGGSSGFAEIKNVPCTRQDRSLFSKNLALDQKQWRIEVETLIQGDFGKYVFLATLLLGVGVGCLTDLVGAEAAIIKNGAVDVNMRALALGPEGPLLEEFWDNMRRYGLYFLTVVTGGLYTLLKPAIDALRNPITAVLVIVVVTGSIYLVGLTVSAMLGINEFKYDYAV